MEEKSFSVSQIGGYIKQIFDAEELLHDIKVFGEISEFKISQGNAWFSIKDENATIASKNKGTFSLITFISKSWNDSPIELKMESNLIVVIMHIIINNTKPKPALIINTGVVKNLFNSFFTNAFILVLLLTT